MFLKKIVCKVPSGEMRFFRLERFFRGTRRSFRHRKQAKPSEPGPGKRESAANVFRSPLQYRCRLTLLGKQSAGWAAILKKKRTSPRGKDFSGDTRFVLDSPAGCPFRIWPDAF